jgi:hypothetical protein
VQKFLKKIEPTQKRDREQTATRQSKKKKGGERLFVSPRTISTKVETSFSNPRKLVFARAYWLAVCERGRTPWCFGNRTNCFGHSLNETLQQRGEKGERNQHKHQRTPSLRNGLGITLEGPRSRKDRGEKGGTRITAPKDEIHVSLEREKRPKRGQLRNQCRAGRVKQTANAACRGSPTQYLSMITLNCQSVLLATSVAPLSCRAATHFLPPLTLTHFPTLTFITYPLQ